uniref:ABC-transporter substrate-binding protein n=1 Tax=consortium cosmid clone pGZ1 TaxID=397422 RepID=Q0MX91_9BACT|nr:ABC-transporter substrate-binding protein [consortium cosmid clone pGZ1]
MNEQARQARDRRLFLKEASALAGLGCAATMLPMRRASAAPGRLRVGLMMPYSGTFAQLGAAMTNGFKLALEERGATLSGLDLDYVVLDDESQPAKAVEYANKLVKRDNIDVLVGTAHSGVALGMAKVARDTGVLWLIPLATADELTGPLCAPNIFRTSVSGWQSHYPLGKVLKGNGHKTAVFITWKYAAGEQMLAGFKEGYEKEGGHLVKELFLPFPQVEFQAMLTEIASLRPDAVVAFFGGAAASKFLKDYRAAGLKDKIPLYGSGFLTEGVLEAADGAAEGLETTLNYADGLTIAKDRSFRLAYAKTFKAQPDLFAVQGYDAGQLLAAGLSAVKGDVADKAGVIAAMETARIDSPRGVFTMSSAHNPVQDIYLRRVVGKENRFVGVAAKALADPARGCRL